MTIYSALGLLCYFLVGFGLACAYRAARPGPPTRQRAIDSGFIVLMWPLCVFAFAVGVIGGLVEMAAKQKGK